MKYKWKIKNDQEITKDFLQAALNSEIIAKLLLNRGINTIEKAKAYLDPKNYIESKAEDIPNLLIAKDRIIEAINKKEKITIFGDYDVDGVTSTACLLITLKEFTEKVDYYIPSRLTEGYGLNSEAVKTIAKKHKAKLLITCDCGITNQKEIELANELGMDVIVTDHHSLPEILPPAHAVLNPKLLPAEHKLHWLPGVGVAYKLAEAVLKELQAATIKKEDLLDLVTLGMIADLAPLIDENRYLVQIGLHKLANTKKVGLQELLRACGYSPSSGTEHVGFGIAPRINAVGRLTDANLAVKLLTTDDQIEAIHIAAELDIQNRHRQLLCEQTLKEAVEMVRNQKSEDREQKSEKCIVLANENWHHGVVGIVASRVVEKYHLPTILIAIDKEQNIAKGSGRSIEHLDITEGLAHCSKHLEKHGGHKAACGLSIKPENLPNFIVDFQNYVSRQLAETNIEPTIKIDAELSISDVNFELLHTINKLSPFGLGNPTPVFVSNEAKVVSIRTIGKDNQHLKLTLQATNHKLLEALIWNHDNRIDFNINDTINIVYSPKINQFNGETSIQLEIKDWQLINVPGHKSTKVRKSIDEIKIFDYRNKANECLSLLSKESAIYFAEALQKEFFPLKTSSRSKTTKTENLVLLECPADERTLINLLETAQPKKLFLAFSQHLPIDAQHLLKRLIGMLKYAANNKDSIINEIELQSALGINKLSLTYALEVLTRSGFLAYKRTNDALYIKIATPSRQNFNELIEYNLLVSELKKIKAFKEWLFTANIEQAQEVLKKNGVEVNLQEMELVL